LKEERGNSNENKKGFPVRENFFFCNIENRSQATILLPGVIIIKTVE